jgi:hypothetical protein
MTWRDSVRNFLMGASYADHPAVAQTEARVPVPIPYDTVVPSLQLEEQAITALRRQDLREYAPVMSAWDPIVRAAGFRTRFNSAHVKPQAARRHAVRLAQEADVPVLAAHDVPSTEGAPMTASDRRFKQTHGGLLDAYVPIARRAA